MMTTHPAAKPVIHLLLLNQCPILEQLQLEEALLRADHRNWLILNQGAPPAIVMGISGKPEVLIDHTRMAAQPVPVIKRFSGGGTVFIDPHTLFATWICNADHIGVACCPQNIHQWTADFYKNAFPHLGMELRENDYVIGERKWGGNAQYLCRGRWLHHTSMLWDYNPDHMQYLLMPAKKPAYRQQRSHDDFLCCLCHHFSDTATINNKILDGLHARFDVKKIALEHTLEVLQRPHRKMTTLIPEILSNKNF